MKLLKLEKVHDGKYLKNYELTYLNKEGKEKKFEMVSRKEITSEEQLGARPSGVSIVAFKDDKIMLWQNMTNLVPLCKAYIVK